MPDLLRAGLAYAVLSLDQIAVGQFLLSRPLVVGPLMGFILGDPTLGFFAGTVVELLSIRAIPAGSHPVDSTAVTALAVFWGLSCPRPDRSSLVLAFLLAVPAGFLIRRADIWFREESRRLTDWAAKGLERGRASVLTEVFGFSLLLWLLKGGLLFVALGAAGEGLMRFVVDLCPLRLQRALDFAGRLLPVAGFAVVSDYFLSRMEAGGLWPDKR